MPISMLSSIDPHLSRVDELIKDKNYDEALEILTKLYDQGPNKDVMYRLAETLYLLDQKYYSYFMYERIHSLLEYGSAEYFELISTIVSRFSNERYYPMVGYIARISPETISPLSPEDEEKPTFSIAGEEDDDFIEDSDDHWQNFSLEDLFHDILRHELGLDDKKPFMTADEEKRFKNDTILLKARNLYEHHYYRQALFMIQGQYCFGLDSDDDTAAATAIGDNYWALYCRADAISWYEKAIGYGGLNSQIFLRYLSMGKPQRMEILEKSESVKLLDENDGLEIAYKLFELKEYKWSLFFVQKTMEDFPDFKLPPLLLEYARHNNGDPTAKEEILEHFRKYRCVLPYMLINKGVFPKRIDLRRNIISKAFMYKMTINIVKLLCSKKGFKITPEFRRSFFYYLTDREDAHFYEVTLIFDYIDVDSRFNNEMVAALLDCLNSIKPLWMVKENYVFECIRRGYKGPITIMNNAYTHTAVDYLPEGFDDYPELIKYGVISALAIILADETYFNFYDIKPIINKVLAVYNKKGKLPRAISEPHALGQAMFMYRIDPLFKRRSHRNEFFDYKFEKPVEEVEKIRRAIRKVMSMELE